MASEHGEKTRTSERCLYFCGIDYCNKLSGLLGTGAGTIGVVFVFAMIIACLLNMTTVASLSELNALMPNTTGGLAQYTLACMGPFPTLISMVGGYLICNMLSCG